MSLFFFMPFLPGRFVSHYDTEQFVDGLRLRDTKILSYFVT